MHSKFPINYKRYLKFLNSLFSFKSFCQDISEQLCSLAGLTNAWRCATLSMVACTPWSLSKRVGDSPDSGFLSVADMFTTVTKETLN